ncbi:hypothetical protein [Pseudarthrobacter oxydans]|uniref:hypothetical protein n=1 Tax=Pseudarthrobacter oxydans TaxID=1671 RepID=UPI003419EBF5
MRNYCDELNKLSPAERITRNLISEYDFECFSASSWNAIHAESVLAAVRKLPFEGSCLDDKLSAASVATSQCLDGIAMWIGQRRRAEVWAGRLFQKCLEEVNGETDDLLMLLNRLDWWVNGVSENDDGLWAIQEMDPIFYFDICVELARMLTATTLQPD